MIIWQREHAGIRFFVKRTPKGFLAKHCGTHLAFHFGMELYDNPDDAIGWATDRYNEFIGGLTPRPSSTA